MRHAGVDQRLARRVLAGARGEHLAEDDLADLPAFEPGALEQGADDSGAELGGRRLGERAAELAHSGAGGGDDDDVGHGILRRVVVSWELVK